MMSDAIRLYGLLFIVNLALVVIVSQVGGGPAPA
jgi:hypothetical protein